MAIILAYQKQLPYSFKSAPLEWFWAVVAASPVGCLWYDFWWDWTDIVLILRRIEVDEDRWCGGIEEWNV